MQSVFSKSNTQFVLLTLQIKYQGQDGELAEQISNRDKLFKKFKKSKLHIDELIYKEVKNPVQRLIKEKK